MQWEKFVQVYVCKEKMGDVAVIFIHAEVNVSANRQL